MQLFRSDPIHVDMTLEFPPTLTAEQRRTVRALAIRLNLDTTSYGVGTDRYIAVNRRPTPPHESSSALVSHSSQPHLQAISRPIPTSRASTEHLSMSTEPRPPIYPGLRSVRSTGNLHAELDLRMAPPVPQLPSSEMYPSPRVSPFERYDPRLTHRSSQESTGGRSIGFGGLHQTIQPTRQPMGPPQDQTRGFTERPSRESFSQIRPIGHGQKTSSHGSLSHGSKESRGGSDTIMDLQVQNPPHPEF
jgi:hypothetical protein